MAVQFNKDSGARFKLVKFPVSTKEVGADGELVLDAHGKAKRKDKEVQEEVPATLEDAIKAEGAKKVFKRYIQSLIIELQGEHRRDLQEKAPGERRRAPYMEELGL